MLAGSANCLGFAVIYTILIFRLLDLSVPIFSSPRLLSSNCAVKMPSESHAYVLTKLDTILTDFGLLRKEHGSGISFKGEIPAASATSSQKIDLSLIGTIPALANAVAATQIYEARGGVTQTIEVDLQRGHNYIDPDIGMTPSINGQVRRLMIYLFVLYQIEYGLLCEPRKPLLIGMKSRRLQSI
jgi:hypothetical protein